MNASEYGKINAAKAYECYADMLFRLAYSMLVSKEDAEDAVLEVFAKYLKLRPVFREEGHEKAWFLRVTINQCHDIQRRRGVRSYTPLEEMAEIAVEDKNRGYVLSSVMKLDEKYKTVILLYYFEDLSIEQISEILKITKSGVKMRLMRGRQLLKNELTEGDDGYV